ncbi:MAG: ATP-binding protein [Lentimicrobiaceae bacterium]|jgi:predicted AAA+ superfamily ATPase|nr:ATP-binding protein [Lentimicrobiaceae bacterium]
MYINRTIADSIISFSDTFKVLLVNGARQIGKTTLLKHLSEKGRKYVTLDNPSDLLLAKTDPKGFFDTYSPPVIIDEIQYAPELFPYIKMIADNSQENGLIWLTGSQQYNMMQGVTESLAGRVAIIDMLGFSMYEIAKQSTEQKPFLPSCNPKTILNAKNIAETFKTIWQGSFPAVIHLEAKSRSIFYDSYIRTYIERDVRQIINIGNETAFITFMKVIAARTGQQLNIDDIARNVGVSPTSVRNWLSVLKTSGLVYLLQPYFKNSTKRLTKTPKLYFLDTGLAAHLAGWTTSEALETGISAGAFFETFVVSEILKSYYHNGETPQLYFYRDEKGKEIDLLIYRDGKYYPIEIKKHATPSLADISAFKIFAKAESIGEGCEICLTPEIQPLLPDINAISIWNI